MNIKISKIKVVVILIIFFLLVLIFNYFRTNINSCGCDCDNKKKEGMISGGMLGHVKRQVRPVVRNVKASFTNPTVEYYANRINQLFR